MTHPDELLTTIEVAAIVRAPASTVRYWRYLGTGPRSFKLGRRVVYRRADLSSWLAAVESAERHDAERPARPQSAQGAPEPRSAPRS